MAAPSKLKTYEYDLNNAVSADATQLVGTDNATNDRKQLMFDIVASMINGGTWTVPWTVEGSSNISASGMDAVNRWSTTGS